MKYFLLIAALFLVACDRATPTTKIAAPQREALEKAKGVEQAIQNDADAMKKQIEEAAQ